MDDMGLAVVGAAGRMGRALVRMVDSVDGVRLSGAIERPGAPEIGQDAGGLAGVGSTGIIITDDAEAALAASDGVLDFTVPAVSVAMAKLAARSGVVDIIGTTGMTPEDEAAVRAAAADTAIIKSGNMSLGVNLLSVLVQQAAKALEAADWDIEVLEMHHRHKVDAPSGTAYLLGEAAAEGRGVDLQTHSVRVRDGQTGARPSGTIGFATLRGGAVIGEHSVLFAGEDETIELTHRALDRSLFARGAVKAALWGRGKPAGLYSMLDVLGLS